MAIAKRCRWQLVTSSMISLRLTDHPRRSGFRWQPVALSWSGGWFPSPGGAYRPPPYGMTLLEVLISCGILVIGLASIASLLPAAGSRLGQAALEDRAGTLAANARTDTFARGLIALDLFSNPTKSIAFGKGMDTIPGLASEQFAPPTAALNQRIDPTRGFVLEDEVVFSAPGASGTPGNEFPGGRRAFKEGLCWGATLVPQKFPAQAGTSAALAIAVFRREPTPQVIRLTQTPQGGGLYTLDPFDETVLKKLLTSCSHVLVAAAQPDRGPRWYQIAASWVTAGTGFVVFTEPDFADFAGPQPSVIAFENIVRVDQYNVALQ